MFGGQNTDYKTRQESYSSVFIENKSLIAKPDKNHRQVFVWGQITDYKTKLKLLTNLYLVADIVRHIYGCLYSWLIM